MLVSLACSSVQLYSVEMHIIRVNVYDTVLYILVLLPNYTYKLASYHSYLVSHMHNHVCIQLI